MKGWNRKLEAFTSEGFSTCTCIASLTQVKIAVSRIEAASGGEGTVFLQMYAD